MAFSRCCIRALVLLGLVHAVSSAPFNDGSYEESADVELLRVQKHIDLLDSKAYMDADSNAAEEEGWDEGWSPMLRKEKADPEPSQTTGLEANSGEIIEVGQEMSNEEVDDEAFLSSNENAGKHGKDANQEGESVMGSITDTLPTEAKTATGFKSVSEFVSKDRQNRDRGGFAEFMKAKLEKNKELPNQETGMEDVATGATGEQNQVMTAGEEATYDDGKETEQLYNLDKDEQSQGEILFNNEDGGKIDSKDSGASENGVSDGKDTIAQHQTDPDQAQALENLAFSKADQSAELLDTKAGTKGEVVAAAQETDDGSQDAASLPQDDIKGAEDLEEEQELAGLIGNVETVALSNQLQMLTSSTNDVQKQEEEEVHIDESGEEKQVEVNLNTGKDVVAEYGADLKNNDIDTDTELNGEVVETGKVNQKVAQKEYTTYQTSEVDAGKEEDSSTDIAANLGVKKHSGAVSEDNGPIENHDPEMESMEEGLTQAKVVSESDTKPEVENEVDKQDTRPVEQQIVLAEGGKIQDIQEAHSADTGDAPDTENRVMEETVSGVQGDGEVGDTETARRPVDESLLSDEEQEQSESEITSKTERVNTEKDLNDHEIVVELMQFLEKMSKEFDERDSFSVSEDKLSKISEIETGQNDAKKNIGNALNEAAPGLAELGDSAPSLSFDVDDNLKTQEDGVEMEDSAKTSEENESADQVTQNDKNNNENVAGSFGKSQNVVSEEEPNLLSNAELKADWDNSKVNEDKEYTINVDDKIILRDTDAIEDVNLDTDGDISKTVVSDNGIEGEKGAAVNDDNEGTIGDESVIINSAVVGSKSQQLVDGQSTDSGDELQVAGDKEDAAVQTSNGETELSEVSEVTVKTSGDAFPSALETPESVHGGKVTPDDKTADEVEDVVNVDGKVAGIEGAVNNNRKGADGAPDTAEVIDNNQDGNKATEKGDDEEVPSAGKEEKVTQPNQVAAKLNKVNVTATKDIDDLNLANGDTEDAADAQVEGDTNHVKVSGKGEKVEAISKEDTVSNDQNSMNPLGTQVDEVDGISLLDEQPDVVKDEDNEGASSTEGVDEGVGNNNAFQHADDGQSLETFDFARCDLQANNYQYSPLADTNRVTGQLVFRQKKSGGIMDVKARVYGLDKDGPSQYPVDIHEFGDLSSGCESTGERYGGVGTAGVQTLSVKDAAEFGNVRLDVTATFRGRYGAAWRTDSVGLVGEDSILGRAIVIHDHSDDSGRASEYEKGTKMACCIVARSSDVTPWI